MKKLLLLLTIASPCYAQGVRHVNIAQGTVTLSGASGFSGAVVRPIAGAVVTVCTGSTLPALGSTCTGLASIFSDIALTQTITQPTNADSQGNYSFYAAGGVPYVVSVSAVGFTTYSYVWSAPPSNSASNTLTGAVTISSPGSLNVGVGAPTTLSSLNGVPNAAQQTGVDIGAKINAAIQGLPTAPVGGAVYIPTLSTGCYSFSTQIVVDRPVHLYGDIYGFGTAGTCLQWTGGASAAIAINGTLGASAHSLIEKFTLRNTGTGTVGIDVFNGQYQVTIRDVDMDSGPFSVAAIRLGNNTSGSATIDTKLDNVRLGNQVIGLQLLLANTPLCDGCHIYNGTTANVQVGDSTHVTILPVFLGGNIEQDLANTPNVIVNNVDTLNFFGVYTETTNGGNWLQVPNTATAATQIGFYGGRFSCNNSAANLFSINLSTVAVTVDGSYITSCPASSNIFAGTAASRLSILNVTMPSTVSYGSASVTPSAFSTIQGSTVNSVFLDSIVSVGGGKQTIPNTASAGTIALQVPIADQTSLGSSSNRWSGDFYNLVMFRSAGAAGVPDITGNGSGGALVLGDASGVKLEHVANDTGLQLFNTTTTCTTAATINTPCTTAAITLPVGYADTNYRLSISCLGVTAFPQVQTYTKSNTTFTITLNNLTAAAATCSSFDVIAGHN